jgi:hypothetical protein
MLGLLGPSPQLALGHEALQAKRCYDLEVIPVHWLSVHAWLPGRAVRVLTRN